MQRTYNSEHVQDFKYRHHINRRGFCVFAPHIVSIGRKKKEKSSQIGIIHIVDGGHDLFVDIP